MRRGEQTPTSRSETLRTSWRTMETYPGSDHYLVSYRQAFYPSNMLFWPMR